MSIENYSKAIKVINANKEHCFFAGNKSEELVSKAEEALEIRFSSQYRKFVLDYGAGSIGAEEIYGVVDDDFDNSSVPNGVWFTLTERQEIQMPENLLVLCDTGSDEFFCLDFNKLNNDGEPPVVAFIPGVDNEHQTYEIIAEDFGNYLLQVVEQELV
ncbi:SMI1/KNR4 family protein [Clostridium kluyveri]|uniref:Cell wall assembly protein n=1 Tax=Clostridium kluyveri TaxID=1534 RepID=A0A1L5F3X1_CLOKL|nr:SMI1/KNR4 family protein [Clostridium kluyveri]APM37705.1 cell wall assembly protein [Clostridium kluyveri]